MSNVTQWADGHFSAAHRGGGVLHGHTWRVRAHWAYLPLAMDALERKTALSHALAQLDHSELPEALTRAEQIAEWIGRRVNACRVDVSREAEGLGATWTA